MELICNDDLIKVYDGVIRIKTDTDIILPENSQIKIYIKTKLKISNKSRLLYFLKDFNNLFYDFMFQFPIFFMLLFIVKGNYMMEIIIFIVFLYNLIIFLFNFIKKIYQHINYKLLDYVKINMKESKNQMFKHIFLNSYTYQNDTLKLILLNKNDEEITLYKNKYYFTITSNNTFDLVLK